MQRLTHTQHQKHAHSCGLDVCVSLFVCLFVQQRSAPFKEPINLSIRTPHITKQHAKQNTKLLYVPHLMNLL
jgi:hypothetical protein